MDGCDHGMGRDTGEFFIRRFIKGVREMEGTFVFRVRVCVICFKREREKGGDGLGGCFWAWVVIWALGIAGWAWIRVRLY